MWFECIHSFCEKILMENKMRWYFPRGIEISHQERRLSWKDDSRKGFKACWEVTFGNSIFLAVWTASGVPGGEVNWIAAGSFSCLGVLLFPFLR